MKSSALVLVVLHLVAAMSYACACSGTGGCGSPGCTCGCGTIVTASPASTSVTSPPDGTPDPTNPAVLDTIGATINVTNFAFSSNPTISAGQSVTWDWVSGTHTVTSATTGEVFDSGLKSSGTFSHTFLTPGHYTYFCQLHGSNLGNGNVGGMSGFINVVAVPEPMGVDVILATTPMLLWRRRRASDLPV